MPKHLNKPKAGGTKVSYLKNINRLMAILLVLGYVEINVVNVENGTLTFTLRGPALGRLTSGMPITLRPVGTGLSAQAHLRLEALITYLLLIGEATIDTPGVSATTTVWGVSSKWFKFAALQNLLKDNQSTFTHRTAILVLLNLATGIGLINRKLEFVLTGFALNPDDTGNAHLRFFLSGPSLTRQHSSSAGKYTPPPYGTEFLYWIGVIVGILLITQHARVVSVGVQNGGGIGFDISTFSFKALPLYVQKLLMSRRSQD